MLFHNILLVSSFTEVQKECKLSTTEEVQFAWFAPVPPALGILKHFMLGIPYCALSFFKALCHLTVFDRSW